MVGLKFETIGMIVQLSANGFPVAVCTPWQVMSE
jgi:hypothetical protein